MADGCLMLYWMADGPIWVSSVMTSHPSSLGTMSQVAGGCRLLTVGGSIVAFCGFRRISFSFFEQFASLPINLSHDGALVIARAERGSLDCVGIDCAQRSRINFRFGFATSFGELDEFQIATAAVTKRGTHKFADFPKRETEQKYFLGVAQSFAAMSE